MAVIAIEEHFTSPQLRKLIAPREGPIQAMLDNMSTRLIADMDEGGIDIAVLSENNPAAQNLDPETSVAMAKASNDFLYETIQANPKRFKGFAALPLPDPKAAADELERGVTKLGLLGAMIMGTTKGQFVDDKKFWPVFERAAKLDVPVYIHPSPVKPAIAEAFFKRIMFAVDWPYIDNALGTKWLKAAPISDKDRGLIFEGNARKLLKM